MTKFLHRRIKCSVFHALFALLLRLSANQFFVKSLAVFTPPPSVRLALGQEEALKRDCRDVTQNTGDTRQTSFVWAPEIEACDYTLATKIFKCLACNTTTSSFTSVWLPRLSDDTTSKQSLARLVQVLNDNAHRLGNITVDCTSWPTTPATRVRIATTKSSTSIPPQKGSGAA